MTCDYIYAVWGPHEGCREFMTEPETLPCVQEATIRFTIKVHAPEGAETRELDTCDGHAGELDSTHDAYRQILNKLSLRTEPR